MAKEYFDLILFAPLEVELEAVFASFPHRERRTSENILKYTVDLGVDGYSALVAQPPEWGNQEALRTATHLLNTYDAGLIVCVGIAGTLSNDLRLGDVCYSGTILDIHERTKVKEAKNKNRRSTSLVLQHSPKTFVTPTIVTVALNHLRSDPELRKKFYEPWQSAQLTQLERRYSERELDPTTRPLFGVAPKALNGALICGPVVASNSYGEVLKALDRKVLAVETESGGIFQAAQDARTLALTVRGISDHADAEKTELEELMQGKARQVASANAVTFIKAQLQNPEFLEIIKAERSRQGTLMFCGMPAASSVQSPITAAIKMIADEIEGKLKELCPEFPLTQKGYHLPSPRIRPMRPNDDPRAEEMIDLLDAIERHQIIIVDIPRNYPDLALPYVWADRISIGTIGNSQVVPVVLDGKRLAPPSTIEKLLSGDLASIGDKDGAQLVFVIQNVNLGSRTRVKNLNAEIQKYPGAKFVLITKAEGNLLLQHELVKARKAQAYSLCAVPFLAISEFIQTAFELATAEAEVIALKLKNTFSKFKLSAHPTYFAGIPRPMLSNLLEANRRAELIQLEVDGYLTLITAQDEAATHLNRATRARYLARLAVELDVEKRSFSQSQLVDFTKAFAQEYDFDDLDPLSFINSFIQKGILQFEEDRVEFTLPFIRSYLLATALRDYPALAKRYFDIGADDFDFETFDLYSELGPSEEIILEIENRLTDRIGDAETRGGVDDIMFSNKLRPAILQKLDRLGEIRAGLERTIKALQEVTADGDAKQKLLDIADHVSEQAAEKTVDKIDQSGKRSNGVSESEALIREWRIANVLLGAAAQRLTGAVKQRLAALLVVGGAEIANRLTRLYAEVDFKDIKAKIMESDSAKSLLASVDSEAARAELKQQVSNFIDLVELYALAVPFRGVLNDLCDQSGDKVLAGSVARAEVPDGLSSLMRFTWLADLDSGRALPGLRKQIAELPLAPFLRIVLTQHFLFRVYWMHADRGDRAKLLEAAAEVVKAFGAGLPKGELQRWIGKSDDSNQEE